MVSFAGEMPHHQGQRVPVSGYKKKEGEAREEGMGTERVAGMKRRICLAEILAGVGKGGGEGRINRLVDVVIQWFASKTFHH